MCLFRKEDFKDAKRLNGIVAAGIIAMALAMIWPFIHNLHDPGTNQLQRFASAQLGVSAIGFVIILLTLCLVMVQVRKSMAKPRIKVAFNKRGEQQATLIYEGGKLTTVLPSLWLINKGNAVARYFQIDFIIPENIGKQSRYTHIASDDGDYILPHTNDGKYTLFVNQYLDSGIRLDAAVDTKKCSEADEDSFEIKYRIYGDWAETQEGKLKVNIKKL